MTTFWKDNWEQTKEHFRQWWNHEGFVLGAWGLIPGHPPREELLPLEQNTPERFYFDAAWRARYEFNKLATSWMSLDVLPVASTYAGPGALGTYLGCEAHADQNTVWYDPIWADVEEPESLPPITFDPENRFFRHDRELIETLTTRGEGKFLTGLPDLIENMDTLSQLRGNAALLYDMIDRPDWVLQKVMEINQCYFQAFDLLWDLLKDEDGGGSFAPFSIWAPGKTAKVQCDMAAQFSPAMFEQFVVPGLEEQCRWLEYSVFHLDGPACIAHLDLLLGIDALDAIQWTPGPKVPPPTDEEWFPMYRKILQAGKSLLVLGVKLDQVAPILDALGTRGVYMHIECPDIETAKEFQAVADRYR